MVDTIETIYHRRMLLNSAAVAERRAASGDYPRNSTENPPMCLSKVSETNMWRLEQPGRLRRLRLCASPVGMLIAAEESSCHHPPLRLNPRMSSEKSPRALLFRACLSWRRDSASPRQEHRLFEGNGSLACGHSGAPHACIRIAFRCTS